VNAHIAAQIAAAQTEAAKVFDENPKVDFDSRTLRPAKGVEIKISAPGDVVSTEIVNSIPVEGPKLGAETKQGGSTVHAADGPQPWGKPNRR
jgi:hypothetical protein